MVSWPYEPGNWHFAKERDGKGNLWSKSKYQKEGIEKDGKTKMNLNSCTWLLEFYFYLKIFSESNEIKKKLEYHYIVNPSTSFLLKKENMFEIY